MVENLPANEGATGDAGSIPVWGRFPWRRAWQPTPAFLPRESHGQRSLVGWCPCVCTESDATEATWQQQQQCNSPTLSMRDILLVQMIDEQAKDSGK